MTAFTTKELEDALTAKLMVNFGKTAEEAGETEMLRASALVLRDAMLAWKDVIAKAPTGTGKTFAYGIPIVEHIAPEDETVQAVILAPTRELAIQITDELRDIAEFRPGVRMVCLYGGQPIGKQIDILKRKPQIVVATPGRLADHMVINVGWVKDAKWDQILEEIKTVKAACRGKLLKVIIETCFLTDAEKIRLCGIVTASGADFIKTSTGFGGGGATREDVALFKAHGNEPHSGGPAKARSGAGLLAGGQSGFAALL